MDECMDDLIWMNAWMIIITTDKIQINCMFHGLFLYVLKANFYGKLGS